MTKNSTTNTGQDTAWDLIAEFTPGDDPDFEESLTSQVVEAIRELEIDPAVLSRVRKRMRESIRTVERKRKDAWSNSLLTVRVWVRRSGAGRPVGPVPDPVQVDRPDCCGWGFFLVEKKVGASQHSQPALHYLIELFLYWESPTS